MTEAFVYCWTDHRTNKLYVGSHKGSENDGYICSSRVMMQEYKLRPTDFTRQIVASGSWSDMLKFEENLLITIGAAKDPHFYNLTNGGKNFVLTSHTDESKRKISNSKLGVRRTEEQKARIREGCKKRKPLSAEALAKISARNTGKFRTEETKRKMSLSQAGKPRSSDAAILGWKTRRLKGGN